MRLLILLVAVAAYASAHLTHEQSVMNLLRNRVFTKETEALSGNALVHHVNRNQRFFKAKLNRRFEGLTFEEKRRRIAGVAGDYKKRLATENVEYPTYTVKDSDIPASFDSVKQWPSCPSIGYIRDQSDCGSCWAVAAAEVMSDRVCIGSNGKQTAEISAADLMACCGWSCGMGCNGGYPYEAFAYWKKSGVVTGSNFDDHQGCFPYPFAPCEHHTNKTHYEPCPDDMYKTPKCTKACVNGYTTKYADDKIFGKSAYSVKNNVAEIQKEIMTNGPVEAAFDVYEDFEHYSSGIYVRTSGKFMGGHAVRIVGWGSENGVAYWKVANSWNEDWGEDGYFRIIRGINECDFEAGIVAGLAKV